MSKALSRLLQREQFALLARDKGAWGEHLVEAVFGRAPWEIDPERVDPLAEALEAWTHRAISAFLEVLRESDADLWLVHDRAVVFSGGALDLGPWVDDWSGQVRPEGTPIEASDALARIDALSVLLAPGQEAYRKERWLWTVAAGQRHLVEALAIRHTR